MMRGLTLIETLLYLALLSLLLTGALVSAYALQETALRSQTMARLEHDGAFILNRLHQNPDLEKIDIELLTPYGLSEYSYTRSGEQGDAENPEQREVWFSLHAHGDGFELRRAFYDTIYLNTP